MRILALPLLLLRGAAIAQTPILLHGAAIAQTPKPDPRVETILARCVAAYRALPALRQTVTAHVESGVPDFGGTMPLRVDLRMRRPNRLWLDYTLQGNSKPVRHLVVSDGAMLWTWDGGTNTYTRRKAPATLAALQGLPDLTPDLDALLFGRGPFADFRAGGPAPPLTIVRTEKVGGVETDVLESRMTAPEADYVLALRFLIGQKDALLRRMTVAGSGKDASTGKDRSFRVNLDYAPIDLAPAFGPADFRFVPPPGAHLVVVAERPARGATGAADVVQPATGPAKAATGAARRTAKPAPTTKTSPGSRKP